MNKLFDHIAGQVLGNKITDIPANQQDTCGNTNNSLGVACDSAAGHAGRHSGFVAGSFHHLSWPNKSDLSDEQKIELLRDALWLARTWVALRIAENHEDMEKINAALELTEAK